LLEVSILHRIMVQTGCYRAGWVKNKALTLVLYWNKPEFWNIITGWLVRNVNTSRSTGDSKEQTGIHTLL